MRPQDWGGARPSAAESRPEDWGTNKGETRTRRRYAQRTRRTDVHRLRAGAADGIGRPPSSRSRGLGVLRGLRAPAGILLLLLSRMPQGITGPARAGDQHSGEARG